MLIEFDEQKRQKTLSERELDFIDAHQIFEGVHLTNQDNRFDYGEIRYITMGYMNARLVVIAWTYRPIDNPTHRHIISMRHANDREIKKFNLALTR